MWSCDIDVQLFDIKTGLRITLRVDMGTLPINLSGFQTFSSQVCCKCLNFNKTQKGVYISSKKQAAVLGTNYYKSSYTTVVNYLPKVVVILTTS